MKLYAAIGLSLLVTSCAHAPTSEPTTADAASPVPKINAEAARAAITVTPLRRNMSVLMGSGGNITVLDGVDGKLLVDCGIAVSKLKIAKALASIGPGPVKLAINTHWH